MTASNRPARWRLGLLAASLAAAIAVPALAHDTLRTIGTPPGIVLPPTSEAVPPAPAWDGQAYKGGVVSVSHPLAAQAGADVLARGGNAIDAAAAIQFMLNVVEPQFSGIGGWFARLFFVLGHLLLTHVLGLAQEPDLESQQVLVALIGETAGQRTLSDSADELEPNWRQIELHRCGRAGGNMNLDRGALCDLIEPYAQPRSVADPFGRHLGVAQNADLRLAEAAGARDENRVGVVEQEAGHHAVQAAHHAASHVRRNREVLLAAALKREVVAREAEHR